MNRYRVPITLTIYAVAPRVAARMAGLIKGHPWGDRIQMTMGEPVLVAENVEDPWETRRRAIDQHHQQTGTRSSEPEPPKPLIEALNESVAAQRADRSITGEQAAAELGETTRRLLAAAGARHLVDITSHDDAPLKVYQVIRDQEVQPDG